MTRLSGGEYRGREIRVPHRNVRPTQERVRAAIFNSLAERIPGCRFLDLFAGSGGVGLEAWSRGAATVCWVEADKTVFALLTENVRLICRRNDSSGKAGGVTMPVRSEVCGFMERCAAGPFDVVFLDPPYAGDPLLVRKTLRLAVERSILAPNGVIVVEESASRPPELYTGLTEVRSRNYGDTRVRFLALT